jgi:adenylate cyclase
MGFPMKDDRRPSVASATTVSSTGSKSSMGRGFHKRLQNVFGEDFPADDRQNSDTSLNTQQRNRGNSLSNTIGSKQQSRPTSPTSSRPRTPQASSEVTPWEFQDSKVTFQLVSGPSAEEGTLSSPSSCSFPITPTLPTSDLYH